MPHEMPIRSEWMYQVRSTRQVFHCKVIDADRFDFERAVLWLCETAPPPHTLQEADILTDQLKLSAFEASLTFHEYHHRRSRRAECRGSLIESSYRMWRRDDNDPRRAFRSWMTSFLRALDATHPPAGVERAAATLREHFQAPLKLDALAAEIGMSRSALTRAFREEYGMTCGEYLTRVRLRWFVEQARDPHSRAGQLASDAGYASYHNLSDALIRRTGFKPSAVRNLSDDQTVELLRRPLSLLRLQSIANHTIQADSWWLFVGSSWLLAIA